nr:hypothetical protein [Polymorphobacter sp.]
MATRAAGTAASFPRTWVPAALLTAGLFWRLVFSAVVYPGRTATGEIANVAIAYARTGVLADAFVPGGGPTAHVLPIPPVFAGLVYRALGIRSASAEFVLELVAIALVLGSYWFLSLIFKEAGVGWRTRMWGLAVACLVPFNFFLETVDFRIWEGALATFTAFGFVVALLGAAGRPTFGGATIVGLALLAALVFFISPALGLACYLCAAIVAFERLPPRRIAAAAVVVVLALAAVITPWADRNARVMGAPVILRSNFGLELALAHHPAAVADDGLAVFRARLAEIHPNSNPPAFARLQAAGGEAAYAKALGAQAKSWIADHPFEFIKLSLRHLRQYFFPPAWLWHIYVARAGASTAKAMVCGLLSVAGLAGLALGLAQSPRAYRFVAILLLVPPLAYAIVQPVPRYRYLIFGVSLFLAVDLAARGLALALTSLSRLRGAQRSDADGQIGRPCSNRAKPAPAPARLPPPPRAAPLSASPSR